MNSKLFVFLRTIVFVFSFVLLVSENSSANGGLFVNSFDINFKSGKDTLPKITRPRIFRENKIEKNSAESNAKKAVISFELERKVFDLINQKRASVGLAPLAWNDDVARIARSHSENMANFHFFSHESLDGLMVNERADLFGVSHWRSIGENIAYNKGYDNPADFAVERWMQSSGHRENILNSRWKESAIGVAVTPDKTFYFTEVFLLRK